MITVDTSALVEIVLDRPLSDACMSGLAAASEIKMSAANLAEALIVSSGHKVLDEMNALLATLPIDFIPVTSDSARRAAEAYRRWGRGFHPAALNFGDCFAYEVAAGHGGRLLFVGEDFAKTDLASVL